MLECVLGCVGCVAFGTFVLYWVVLGCVCCFRVCVVFGCVFCVKVCVCVCCVRVLLCCVVLCYFVLCVLC